MLSGPAAGQCCHRKMSQRNKYVNSNLNSALSSQKPGSGYSQPYSQTPRYGSGLVSLGGTKVIVACSNLALQRHIAGFDGPCLAMRLLSGGRTSSSLPIERAVALHAASRAWMWPGDVSVATDLLWLLCAEAQVAGVLLSLQACCSKARELAFLA